MPLEGLENFAYLLPLQLGVSLLSSNIIFGFRTFKFNPSQVTPAAIHIILEDHLLII